MLDVSQVEHVTGGSGVRLAVRTAGPADAPPILLLHGWAQSGAVWQHQLTGPLSKDFRLVAADLRGHGDSDAPEDGYASAAEWAADVRALLDYTGRPAVVIGWSYGGLVLTDHVRELGTDGVAGIMYVSAITEIGRGHPGGRTGPAMRDALPDALSPDRGVAEPALRSFAVGMHAPGLRVRPTPLAEQLLAAALRVPPHVRGALFRRDVGSAEVLATIDVPTLVLHGRADAVVEPSAAEYTAAHVPGAELRWCEGVGHLPFLERPAEFEAALRDLVERTRTR
ncbi:MAG TPA: alpha/beta hydrolase [Pseudonocardiaceae bacterium]|nr:alpha/beta hydrolase [Pseudonocardiaceae bacterium]